MKNLRLFAYLMMVFASTVASAQSSTPWDGFYLGANVGSLSSKVCTSSTLNGAGIDPTIAKPFTGCSGSGLAGGLQFGENFQLNRVVLGIGVDLLVSSSKDANSTLSFTGQAPPPGTYSFSGKLSPNDFAVIGGRIGYGGNLIFPYLRAGGVVTSGSKSSNLNYAPAGTTAPVASFSGGKNFNSTGWAAGGGAEIGLNGAWSISAEYLRINLGKGSSSTTTCAGAAGACAAFAGVTLDNSHSSFTANVFRIGINYWFNYWDKP